MKILINTISLLTPLTGIGTYTYNLAKEFLRQRPEFRYTFYRGYFTSNLLPPKGAQELIKIPLLSFFAKRAKKFLFLLSQRSKEFDLYFEPNFIPLKIKARKIVTTVHDFSFHLYPEWHPNSRVDYFRQNFFTRISLSDVVVTPSEYIKKEAEEILGNNLKIVSIPNGYNPKVFYHEEEKARKNFVLFVGAIEPRKNLKNLILAYKSLPDNIRKEFRLVLAGDRGWKNDEIMELIDSSKKHCSIDYIGYVNERTLSELYQTASCLVYPSFYEGFGLPPLEAMACGCPVIVSNVPSLQEVCKDAAYYVDPGSIESIANGIYRVLTDSDLRRNMEKKGLERARNMTWENSARGYIALFESLV
jgi:glycosyltransferase involved in cell wall biosynthesis